jgi:hypothetical protein
MAKLPVDFERLAKLPANPAAGGYPYRISAADLMRNFKHCNLAIDPAPVDGLYLEEGSGSDGERSVKLAGQLPSSVPDGTSVGDLLYWAGSSWQILSAPSGSGMKVLTCNGGTLAWTDTEACS